MDFEMDKTTGRSSQMKFGPKMQAVAMMIVLTGATALSAQTAPWAKPAAIISSGQISSQSIGSTQIVREVHDPHLGTRWLLLRDPGHPGGPGRLVMISSERPATNSCNMDSNVTEGGTNLRQPVIHAGDRVVLEERSPRVDARLEAVALGPAVIGSVLEVRLKTGGSVVRAVALGPGRAGLQPETGVQR
jgi:hypothetical protein